MATLVNTNTTMTEDCHKTKKGDCCASTKMDEATMYDEQSTVPTSTDSSKSSSFSKTSSNDVTGPMTSSSESGMQETATPSSSIQESDANAEVESDDKTSAPFEPDEEWQDCSLCDGVECDDDAPVPLPGRESHTADMDQFLVCLRKVQTAIRHPLEPAFHEGFWVFFKTILDAAVPVGYAGVEDPKAVVDKSAADSGALIAKYIATSPINPIYPAQLASMAGIPLEIVLTELLHASRSGMMSMRWTPVCERCGTPTCSKIERLTESVLPTSSWCNSCRFENPIDCLSKINVVFILSNDVFYSLAEGFACKPSNLSLSLSMFYTMIPATYSGSGFRVAVGCDGDRAIRPEMPAGTYRMHCPIALTDNWFVVDRDATPKDEPHTCTVHVSDYVYRGGERKVLRVPHGRVRFEVFCDTQSYFILWIQHNLDDRQLLYVPPEERPLPLSASLVMQNVSYRLLYEGTEIEKDHFEGAVAKMTSSTDADVAAAMAAAAMADQPM